MRLTHGGREVGCGCAYRAAFRACYNQFRQCGTEGERVSVVSLDWVSGVDGRRCYSRKREEYRADFWLVSVRVLHAWQARIFRFHFILGADWRLCCRQLNLDRGTFFHEIYRIEQRLGRVFAELQPYALFPVNEYFAPPRREMRSAA